MTRVLFGNIPGARAIEIAKLGLDAEIEMDVEKAKMSAKGKFLATAFILRSEGRRYSKLILLLNNDYVKQQKKLLQEHNGNVRTDGGLRANKGYRGI